MTNIEVDNEIYADWVKFYETHNKLKYPTLKNFTAQKLIQLMKGG